MFVFLSLSFHLIDQKTVSDQLKNSRLASSSSSQLKHLLSSSLPSSGSMQHHQDPLEAALLAAARSQHGAGIPGNVQKALCAMQNVNKQLTGNWIGWRFNTLNTRQVAVSWCSQKPETHSKICSPQLPILENQLKVTCLV